MFIPQYWGGGDWGGGGGGSLAFLVVFHRASLVLLEDKVQYLPVWRCFTSWVVPQEDNISVTGYWPKLKQKAMFRTCASNMQL